MVRKTKNIQFYEAIGRRKEAVARIRLYLVTNKEKKVVLKHVLIGKEALTIKQGEIFVNKKPLAIYFPSLADRARFFIPLKLTNNENRFAISIIATGGGKSGQIEAIIHGLSRAIEKADKDQYRITLKKAGLLTRDPRTRERRHVGTGGKSRRQKQSPKR